MSGFSGPVPPVYRSYLAGLTLSTAGSSATFGVAIGQAADLTNVSLMNLASAYTKTTSAWAVGTGNGSLDTGTIAASTWYHAHLVQRLDTGVVDIITSLSATGPTLPTNYTLFRRIGAMKTNGSSQWILFTQVGDDFIWNSPVQDQNLSASLGTTAQTLTLASIPTLLQLNAKLRANAYHASSVAAVLISSLDEIDNPPGTPAGNYNVVSFLAGTASGIELSVRTNTSAQIRARATGSSVNLQIISVGWTDRRGRDA